MHQEMIRRMTNTTKMVAVKIRILIVDEYAQKLINSEYSLEQARNFVIGGLKGYERLLSLSRDRDNPRWKPLHMAANWNAKNRRTAKRMSKTNWFKGKSVVEPPSSNQRGDSSTTSPDNNEEYDAQYNHQGVDSNNSEDKNYDAPTDESGKYDDPSINKGGPNHWGGKDRDGMSKKKRGLNRKNITLGGLKKVEMATKRKAMQKLNKKLGKMSLPATGESNGKMKRTGPPPPTVSVCFIDNTANGVLVKRMQGVEY